MSSCEKTSPLHLGCHPYLTIACIVSCLLCTIVMIWGTLAMRADMKHMEMLMLPVKSEKIDDDTLLKSHCSAMPDMQ